jgi:hypothetical protein
LRNGAGAEVGQVVDIDAGQRAEPADYVHHHGAVTGLLRRNVFHRTALESYVRGEAVVKKKVMILTLS